MPSALPDGEEPPANGRLPSTALAALPTAPFGIYVHVPYCRVRCGYCDFNTYVPGEQGWGGLGGYVDTVLGELRLAAAVLGTSTPVQTVFVGGGTPTLLPWRDLARLVETVEHQWGLARDAELTVEANPDTVTPRLLTSLAAAGYTRVSLGMQSAVPSVLATLERTHRPDNVAAAVTAARAAGLSVSLDLVYGTPGESLPDWQRSLDAVLELEPDHVSAYALTVEDGTRLSARVRRGELPAPDDDEAAKYELADATLHAAGYRWYEVSNWARRDAARCRHNVGYWSGGNWWGAGPGAHSHVGGVRWWNVRHPTAYAGRVTAGRSPAAAREVLTPEQRYCEQVLLGVRLEGGLPLRRLRPHGAAAVPSLVADGLADAAACAAGRLALTLRGRLLADTVVHAVLE